MDSQPLDPGMADELLESVHSFPGSFQFKVIGAAADDFEGRAVAAAAAELAAPSDVDHTTRMTQSGRHVSVTLDVTVQNPGQVRAIYARLRQLEGLAYLL